jgi:hypothetical protein
MTLLTNSHFLLFDINEMPTSTLGSDSPLSSNHMPVSERSVDAGTLELGVESTWTWDETFVTMAEWSHHEIGEVLFLLDIFGKVTSKIVGLYSETKLDKVVYKHEQIGIEGQDIARGP